MALSAETLAALEGPPRSYIIDWERYEVLADGWWPALSYIHPDASSWAFTFLMGVSHEDDGEVLAERLLDPDDPLSVSDLTTIAERLVERATGRKWWVAGRLATITDYHWAAIDGRMTARGVDLLPMLRMQPSRAFNLVRFLLYENADEKRQHELDSEILRPPHAALARRQSVAEDAAAFEAAFAAGANL